MAKTDKMLAEANCELMRKEAQLLALGLGLEEKESVEEIGEKEVEVMWRQKWVLSNCSYFYEYIIR